MYPIHQFTAAERPELERILINLSHLGEKGMERVEFRDRPILISAPNWWGRAVEYTLGKRETLKQGSIAVSFELFLKVNEQELLKCNRLNCFTALDKIAQRFHNQLDLCVSVGRLKAELRNVDLVALDRFSKAQADCNQIDEDNRVVEERIREVRVELNRLKPDCDKMQADSAIAIQEEKERILDTAHQQAKKIIVDSLLAANKTEEKERTKLAKEHTNKYEFTHFLADESKKDLVITCKDGELRACSLFLPNLSKIDFKQFSKETVEFFVNAHYGITSFAEISAEKLGELKALSLLVLTSTSTQLLKSLEAKPNPNKCLIKDMSTVLSDLIGKRVIFFLSAEDIAERRSFHSPFWFLKSLDNIPLITTLEYNSQLKAWNVFILPADPDQDMPEDFDHHLLDIRVGSIYQTYSPKYEKGKPIGRIDLCNLDVRSSEIAISFTRLE